MNANELADKLDNFYSYVNEPYLLVKTSTMLRQQEQTIERYYNMMRDKDAKIADLEKDLFMLQKHYDQLGVRELTDEEIKAIVYTYWTEKYDVDLFGFARELLKKASEK
jgi:hypothetical protein